MIKAPDDPAEVQTLVTAITDAAEAAIGERISVWSSISESHNLWDVLSHPEASNEAERQTVVAIECSSLLRPLLDHGAPDGMLYLGQAGQNISATNIALGLIANSLREAVFIDGNIDRVGLESVAHRNLRRLLATVRGHAYPTCMVIGLDVSIQPGMHLPLPWGHLVSRLIQAPAIGMLVGPLLIVPVSVRSWLGVVRNDQRYARAEALADRALLLLRTTFALAFDDVLPPVQRWRAILGPGPTSMSIWSTPSYSVHGDGLSPELAPELEAWAIRLEILHDSRLDIATERLARARAERNSWEDQLIDAVIAWENICSGSSETTFRVTGSLAKLIERQPGAAREKLLDDLGTVYGVRSALVHGGRPERREVISSAGTAIDIARRALRTIYGERENLIPMTSGQRANQLLMQEP